MSFVSFMIINGYFIWLYVTGFTLTFQFDYNYKVNITFVVGMHIMVPVLEL